MAQRKSRRQVQRSFPVLMSITLASWAIFARNDPGFDQDAGDGAALIQACREHAATADDWMGKRRGRFSHSCHRQEK